MDKVYSQQSLLTLNLETGNSNVATAEVKKILFKRPDETKGFWTATADGTKLVHVLSNGEINMPGLWQFQAYIELAGKKGFGLITNINFLTSIE
ncbi:MAG: hypothetical protein ABIR78_05945 [Ferruginibacter sp.]